MRVRLQVALLLSAMCLLPATVRAGSAPPATHGAPPRLVVLLVVDQLRADQLLDRDGSYAGGYRRVLDGGAVYEQCRFLHGPNETGPGHAVIATGAWGHRSGITANSWWAPGESRATWATEDPSARVVGAGDTTGRDCRGSARPASPYNLLAETLGDQLWARTSGRGRVVSITGKDRSAVMLAGFRGKAYWPDECSGRLVTSSFYHPVDDDLPGWLRRFNARTTGPMPPAGREREFLTGPDGSDWALAAAESAVAGLGLGTWEAPDLLCVGLTPHDVIGHCHGPRSPEMAEACRREDLALGAFLDFLDQRVGREAYLLVLCGDHGIAQLPEAANAGSADPEMLDPLRPHARHGDAPLFEDRARRTRFPKPARFMADGFVRAADSVWATLGAPAGRWRLRDPYLYFFADSTAAREPLPEAALLRLRADLTARFPVARMFVRSELRDTSATRDPLLRPARLAYLASRAGEFYVVSDPGVQLTTFRDGTGHGTPYACDNHVALVFYGRGVRAARHPEPVSPADIAPTLGARLGIGPPNRAEGQVLDP
jgi:hypothetical protein